MIGPVEGHEALGMTGGFVKSRGIFNPDGLVNGRVQDQQRAFQTTDTLQQICLPEVLDELFLYLERPPGNGHL